MGSPATLITGDVDYHPSLDGHAERVTAIAGVVARRLGCRGHELRTIELGGPLHDVGKLTIAVDVLVKPGRLDAHELLQIRAHPVAGARLLDGVRGLRKALPCVLHHHERWDGAGYPHGLAGKRIPLVARILAVADAFDAMTTTRPYRDAMPAAAALAEVRRCSGSQFDPAASRALLAAWDAGELPTP